MIMPPKVKFTKEEIIEAALALAADKGIRALTARELGAALNSSIGKQAKIKDIRLEEANIDDIIRVAYGGTDAD